MKTDIVIKNLTDKKMTISTMESCTGGALVSEITRVPGASVILKYSAVTYANEFKVKMGVPKEVIDKYTVYSPEVAREMAYHISDFAGSDYGVGITGKFNKEDPDNKTGENDKVYISIYDKNKNTYTDLSTYVTSDDRRICKDEVASLVIDKLAELTEI